MNSLSTPLSCSAMVVLPPRCGGAMRAARRAFTLIELLVVMGIIGIFVGLMGSMFKGGTAMQNMAAAQGAITGLVNIARGHASLAQSNSRILIYATRPTDQSTDAQKANYLHQIQVVVQDPTNPNNWIPKAGAPIDLPGNIYVIPPSSSMPVPILAGGVVWPTSGKLWSHFTQGTTPDRTVQITVNNIAADYFYIEFTPRGTVFSSDGEVIALAEAQPAIPGSNDTEPLRFKNPSNVRGLRISLYGAQTQLNEINDFNN